MDLVHDKMFQISRNIVDNPQKQIPSQSRWLHESHQQIIGAMITFSTHTQRLIVFYPLILPHGETEWRTVPRCVVTEAWRLAQNRKAIYINDKGG